MNTQIFKYEGEKQVRIVRINEQIWFVAFDVCQILDIKNSRSALESLKSSQKQGSVVNSDGTHGGNPNMTIISESGFYKLIFKSRKNNAVKFQDWVTEEVLPSIRKTGSYALDQEQEKYDKEADELYMKIVQKETDIKLAQLELKSFRKSFSTAMQNKIQYKINLQLSNGAAV